MSLYTAETIPATFLNAPEGGFRAQDLPKEEEDLLKTELMMVISQMALGPLGGLVGLVLNELWPNPQTDLKQVFQGILDKMMVVIERMVDEKIKTAVSNLYHKLMENELAGLYKVVDYYHTVARTDPGNAPAAFISAHEQILHDMPAFQDADYGYLVLPFFAQVANLHIMLLREGINYADELGLSDAHREELIKMLKDVASEDGAYTSYMKKTFDAHAFSTGGSDECYLTLDYQRENYVRGAEYGRYFWPALADCNNAPEKLYREATVYLRCGSVLHMEDAAKPLVAPNYLYEHKREPALVSYKADMHAPVSSDNGSSLLGLHLHYSDGHSTWYYADDMDEPAYTVNDSSESGYSGVTLYLDVQGGERDELRGFAGWQLGDAKLSTYLHSASAVHVEFKAKDWSVCDVRYAGRCNPLRNVYESGVIVGVHPTDEYITPDKQFTVPSGALCRVHVAEGDGTLDLARYALSEAVPVVLRKHNGSDSQLWQFQEAGENAFRLVNAYNGQALALREGQVLTTSVLQEATSWALEVAEDHTQRLTATIGPGHHLAADGNALTTTTPAAATGGQAGNARWVVVVDPTRSLAKLRSTLPNLTTSLVNVDGRSDLHMTLTNPTSGSTVENWTLQFILPAEAGTALTTTSPVNVTAVEEERGIHVTLIPTGDQRDLHPGRAFSFVLATTNPAPAALPPAAVRLNDTAISG
ncbi:insecticidal delta-endotoxin Cry8Ea1 family protein [Streptomyces hainanensis]|uniref:Pesticidal crystal protein domain-containing protein n=1 Tax=Streptomyces hainanensis TaxID=402648 RepID=A0A4R4STH4_9ACTN|nr:insecticidal delta-endotoxin Cry8Ea1 family protein [Streptomyces hainanensis]TDC67398.1 hypothetical protein E1283_28965 [Streptomyces hainanensis]